MCATKYCAQTCNSIARMRSQTKRAQKPRKPHAKRMIFDRVTRTNVLKTQNVTIFLCFSVWEGKGEGGRGERERRKGAPQARPEEGEGNKKGGGRRKEEGEGERLRAARRANHQAKASVASGTRAQRGDGAQQGERSEPCLQRKKKEREKRGEERRKGRERGCAPRGALLTWQRRA